MAYTKVYLGDGIYAEVLPKARQLRLTTENGLKETNIIYFEDETIKAFLDFLQNLRIIEYKIK